MSIRVLIRSKAGRASLLLYFVDPDTGRERSKTAGTPDRREAERAAALWEREINELRGADGISWRWFRQRFEDEHLAALSSKSVKCYATALNSFERIANPKSLADVTASTLSMYQAALIRDGRPLTTVSSYLTHLRAALNWAEEVAGVIAKAPSVRLPRTGRRKMMRGRPLTFDELRAMLRACDELFGKDGPQFSRLLELMWYSGLRLTEARRLRWDSPPLQVLLDAKPYPQLLFWIEGHKSRDDTTCPIPPDFAEWLEKTPREQRVGLVAPIVHHGGMNRDGKAWHKVGEAISQLGQHCKIEVNSEDGKFASAHDFRRAYGTRWAMHVRPVTLQKMMRHKSLETTLKFYIGLTSADASQELWNSVDPRKVPKPGKESATAERKTRAKRGEKQG